jgi:hypothetical protein
MHQGGGGLTSRSGKSQIGNFGLATNLSLFFLRRFCILCCVPQFFFLVGFVGAEVGIVVTGEEVMVSVVGVGSNDIFELKLPELRLELWLLVKR